VIFPTINREKAEKAFGVFKNISGASITLGYPAVWDISAPDGNAVSKPATATLSLIIGICVAAPYIANNDFGKFQTYGYCGSASVTNDASVAVAAGDILIPVNAQWYLARSAASDGKSGFVYAAEAVATGTTPAAANKKVFIRAL
jgi:hypothetical protein